MNVTNIDFLYELSSRMGVMFYITKPTIYQDVHQVPNYMHRAWPQFTFLFAIELVVRYFQGKQSVPHNEVIVHTGALMFAYTFRYVQYGAILRVFEYIHEHYRIITLANDWHTWFYSIIIMEFLFYCAHRLLHSVNFFWASHLYHHSSTNFNISTALRLSWFEINIVYYYTAILAIAIPPPIMITHMQYMFLYQVWLHTETIGKLGFVEYIFNTPSHHRVHHASNRSYIDKNFGAYLIIFDRLFGTYADEDESVVYGITRRVRGHNIIHQQVYHYTLINRKIIKVLGIKNKLSAIFKGPGWRPDTSRLGNREDIPEVTCVKPDSSLEIPLWQVMYSSFNCVITITGFYLFANHSQVFCSSFKLLAGMFYIILTYTGIASMYDKRSYTAIVETIRCLLYFPLEFYVFPWQTHHQRINYYIINFFSLPNISLSSAVFLMLRLYNALAAIIWSTILFAQLRHTSTHNNNNNNHNNKCCINEHKIEILSDIDHQTRSQNRVLVENLVLVFSLIALILFLLISMWFEFTRSHLM